MHFVFVRCYCLSTSSPLYIREKKMSQNNSERKKLLQHSILLFGAVFPRTIWCNCLMFDVIIAPNRRRKQSFYYMISFSSSFSEFYQHLRCFTSCCCLLCASSVLWVSYFVRAVVCLLRCLLLCVDGSLLCASTLFFLPESACKGWLFAFLRFVFVLSFAHSRVFFSALIFLLQFTRFSIVSVATHTYS